MIARAWPSLAWCPQGSVGSCHAVPKSSPGHAATDSSSELVEASVAWVEQLSEPA